MFNILNEATNGDKIVEEILDDCVSTTRTDENHPDFALIVDFNQLKNKVKSPAANKTNLTTGIIKDILHFKHESTNRLLSHPVIQTYLHLR